MAVVNKDKGIFKMETPSGAFFQISVVKVSHIFNNIGELMKHWTFPIQDGLEYCIQPKTFNWKKPTISGWRLVQILRDANLLRKEMSYEFRFTDCLWEDVLSIINQILPQPSDEFRLRDLIRLVIEEHGRPMFRDIIAAMVKAKHPQFSEHAVYQMLSSYKTEFKKLDVGVYGLAEWKSKGGHS